MRKYTVFLTWADRDIGTALWWIQIKARDRDEAVAKAKAQAVIDFNGTEGEGAYRIDEFDDELVIYGWPKFDLGGKDPA